MDIDWNWFFAAFAQCAAALIAIIAAFTISKLLSESEKVEDRTIELNEIYLKKSDLLRQIENRSFDWHDRINIEYSSDLTEAIENKKFANLSPDEKLEKLFSIEPTLYGVENCAKYLTKKIEETKPKGQPLRVGGITLQSEVLTNFNITPAGLWDNINIEREKIKLLRLESIKLIELLSEKKVELKSRIRITDPLKYTIYILIIALLTTVIYPLHFMPISTNTAPALSFSVGNFINNLLSIRGALLSSLAVTIGGLFVYFLYAISKLQGNYKKLHDSIGSNDLELSVYSKFFTEE